ncbi:MAG: transporter substrate-binding domain-containing protein [Erysipelotrichaceae bacterium]|nr:transporter substrate-binding domain-containing protein [Erysipelotrichaceae bacterium]
MKKLLKALLAFALIACMTACSSGGSSDASSAKKTVEITVGISPDYPPYESLDTNNEIVGFDADMVALFPSYLNTDDTEYVFTWKQMAFENIVTQIQGDQVELGIAGFTYDAERKVAWSQPYAGTSQVAVVAADSDIKTLKDLEGKTLAAQTSTTGETAAKEVKNAKVVSVTNVQEIFTALTAKQYDAVIVDRSVALNYAKAQGFKILEEPLMDEKNYIVAKEGNDEMIALVNKAIAAFIASDDYKKLCEKYEIAPVETE